MRVRIGRILRGVVTVLLLAAVAFAGCIDDGIDDAQLDPAGDGANGTGAPTKEVPFREAGTFPEYTVVTCGVWGCMQVNDQGPSLFEVATNTTIQKAKLTMSWEAVTPVMAELGMTLAWDCDEDGRCETEYDFGSSPLEISVDDIHEEDQAYLLVWAPHRGTEAANLRVSHSQDFQVEGTFTTTAPVLEEDDPEEPR